MKATARQTAPGRFSHRVDMRQHHMVLDEPPELGGDDEGPSPQELLAASLATCTAITMEMYARRKGWDLSGFEVECEYCPADRGAQTTFEVVLRLPRTCDEDQVQRLSAIAARCPVHRTLEGEVSFAQRVESLEPA